MASAMASTCSVVATGRSGAFSWPAPLIRHGFSGIFVVDRNVENNPE